MLFFLNRYYTLFATLFNTYGLFTTSLSNNFCVRFLYWQGYTGIIGCILAQAILQMRIYALYLLDKHILALTVITCTLCATTSAIVMGHVLNQVTVHTSVLGTPFCFPDGVATLFYSFWIPILFSEALLFGLVLFKGFKTLSLDTSGQSLQGRRPGCWRWSSSFRTGRALVRMMVRDSVLYFLAMFAIYFGTMMVWVLGRASLLQVPIGFTAAMSCVLSNRIIFNIRQMSVEVRQEEIDRHCQQASAIVLSLNKSIAEGHSPSYARGTGSGPIPEFATQITSVSEYSYRSSYVVRQRERDVDEVTFDLPSPSFLTNVEMMELRRMRADVEESL